MGVQGSCYFQLGSQGGLPGGDDLSEDLRDIWEEPFSQGEHLGQRQESRVCAWWTRGQAGAE